MIALRTPVIDLKGIGKAAAIKLRRLGIKTVSDVLNHFPERYEDFRHIAPIQTLKGGAHACVKGSVRLIRSARSPRKRMSFTKCLLEDSSGSIQCIWLNQPYIAKMLREGNMLLVAGKISVTKYGMQFINPTYERATSVPIHTARVVPLYALTSGLTHKMFRMLAQTSLPATQYIEDPIPIELRKDFKLMPLKDAYSIIHFPITLEHAGQARARLALQELVTLLLAIGRFQDKVARFSAPAFPSLRTVIQDTITNLPFTLTDDQCKALDACLADMTQSHPMNRMINGDVGSGKTIIAHLLAHGIAQQNGITVLLAPTEILAQQHFASFQKHINASDYTVALYTRSFQQIATQGKTHDATRASIRDGVQKGDIRYIIGTHALLQKTFSLSDLSCVIVDEQHRFGVEQRGTLLLKEQRERARTPHFLSLAATPIPRSLARILFGGTDVSLLQHKPAKRATTTTSILASNQRDKAYNHISREIKKGHQAFVICPLIDESDTLEVKSATKEYELLKNVFPRTTIGLLHGKLPAREKEQVMSDFNSGILKILVATSVVEVGIDVPNATVMLIEGAERFGLAQLHQFRGRIGRSTFPSACFVIQSTAGTTLERLSQFASVNDGFALAQFDMQNRGPGKILGTIQSGFVPFTLADATDTQLIATAQAIVTQLRARK